MCALTVEHDLQLFGILLGQPIIFVHYQRIKEADVIDY
jgi:hypothetical protein